MPSKTEKIKGPEPPTYFHPQVGFRIDGGKRRLKPQIPVFRRELPSIPQKSESSSVSSDPANAGHPVVFSVWVIGGILPRDGSGPSVRLAELPVQFRVVRGSW